MRALLIRAMIRSVVPANAGTYTPYPTVFGNEADAFGDNQRQGLWVPAFAGTTEENYPDRASAPSIMVTALASP